jgi:hypothetical protein
MAIDKEAEEKYTYRIRRNEIPWKWTDVNCHVHDPKVFLSETNWIGDLVDFTAVLVVMASPDRPPSSLSP